MNDTDRTDPVQPTLIGEPNASAGSRSQGSLDVSRGHVGVVAGDRPHFTDETSALLRMRLTAATLVIAVVLATAFAGNLLEGVISLWWVRGTILLISLVCLALLRSRVSFSLSQLRVLELVVFGSVVVHTSAAPCEERLPKIDEVKITKEWA